MEQKNLVPKRRFKEFQNTSAWEQRKVSDFAEETYGGGTPKTSVDEYWGGNLSWIQSSDLNEHQVSGISAKKKITETGLKNSAAKLVPANSIAVVTRVGVGKLAFMPFEYTTSQDFLSLSKLKVDKWFGVYSLYKKLQSELHAVQGTSIKGITKEELLSKKIMVPVDIDEQFKIGSFFKNLDTLITLHQRKLEKMKTLKSAYLSEMFPAEGERVPKRRFAGFTQPWEQRKLGDVVDITMGQSPNGENYTENPDDHILVQGNADIKNGWVVPRVWTTQVTKSADKGDIILSVRAPVGDVGKTQYDVVLGRGVAGIKGNEFIFQTLNKMKLNGFWTRYSTGSTFESINSNDLKEALISIPEEAEQTKIGAFFRNLDHLITLHQRKLEKLQYIKKAYLNEMFV